MHRSLQAMRCWQADVLLLFPERSVLVLGHGERSFAAPSLLLHCSFTAPSLLLHCVLDKVLDKVLDRALDRPRDKFGDPVLGIRGRQMTNDG
jgi:hypothetical protein